MENPLTIFRHLGYLRDISRSDMSRVAVKKNCKAWFFYLLGVSSAVIFPASGGAVFPPVRSAVPLSPPTGELDVLAAVFGAATFELIVFVFVVRFAATFADVTGLFALFWVVGSPHTRRPRK